MNALVRKEIRLVLPFWIVAMVLAVFPVWLLWPGPFSYYLQSPGFGVYGPYAISVLLLGLAPFGQELSLGTFSILLAQPASRQRLWLVKTTILATALVLVLAAFCLSIHIRAESVMRTIQTGRGQWFYGLRPTAREMAMMVRMLGGLSGGSLFSGGLWALMAFASGLWTNLVFRNASAAFWTSLIVPLGLFLLITSLPHSVFEKRLAVSVSIIVAVMGGYSVTGFLWAKWFFLRVQDNQWTGAVLSLPALRRSNAVSATRERKPIRALIRKEIQLHQINLLIAGLLFISHLVVIIVRRTNAAYFGQHRNEAMIWEAWSLLWLVMPVLIGSMAVAEERKLGTLEGFLCLPVTRRREFVAKFVVVMFLGVFLGGVMPMFVEWLGSLIGLTPHILDATMEFNGKVVTFAAEVLGFSAGLAFIAFYASTLTRNLLQALGLALVLSLVSVFLIRITVGLANGRFPGESFEPLWTGPLIGWIGWPVMISTIVALAFRNFKQLNIGGKVWSRNALTVLAALFFTTSSTTVIYHRVWELWMPVEPAHRWVPQDEVQHAWNGGVAWNVPFVAGTYGHALPKVKGSSSRVAVILPNGQLWLRQRPVEVSEVEANGSIFEQSRITGSFRDGFMAGSNWREAAASEGGCFAIQADGSLWDLSEVQPGKAGVSEPKVFGESHDWKEVVAGVGHFTALKTDGTMWEWGYKRVSPAKQGPLQRLSAPVQVGNDSDWTAICDSRHSTAAAKSDGSLWRFGLYSEMDTNSLASADRFVEQPEHWLSFAGKHPISLSLYSRGNAIAVVCEDGTLWVGGSYFYEEYRIFSVETAARARREMVRLETGSDWKEVHFAGWGRMVAVTRSGALWSWTRSYFPYGGNIAAEEMPSRYANWISATPYNYNSFLALANDGKVCLWGNSLGYSDDSFDRTGKFLGPTRIKAKTIAEIRTPGSE